MIKPVSKGFYAIVISIVPRGTDITNEVMPDHSNRIFYSDGDCIKAIEGAIDWYNNLDRYNITINLSRAEMGYMELAIAQDLIYNCIGMSPENATPEEIFKAERLTNVHKYLREKIKQIGVLLPYEIK